MPRKLSWTEQAKMSGLFESPTDKWDKPHDFRPGVVGNGYQVLAACTLTDCGRSPSDPIHIAAKKVESLLDVACPVCAAIPGAACDGLNDRDDKGIPFGYHAGRYTAAGAAAPATTRPLHRSPKPRQGGSQSDIESGLEDAELACQRVEPPLPGIAYTQGTTETGGASLAAAVASFERNRHHGRDDDGDVRWLQPRVRIFLTTAEVTPDARASIDQIGEAILAATGNNPLLELRERDITTNWRIAKLQREIELSFVALVSPEQAPGLPDGWKIRMDGFEGYEGYDLVPPSAADFEKFHEQMIQSHRFHGEHGVADAIWSAQQFVAGTWTPDLLSPSARAEAEKKKADREERAGKRKKGDAARAQANQLIANNPEAVEKLKEQLAQKREPAYGYEDGHLFVDVDPEHDQLTTCKVCTKPLAMHSRYPSKHGGRKEWDENEKNGLGRYSGVPLPDGWKVGDRANLAGQVCTVVGPGPRMGHGHAQVRTPAGTEYEGYLRGATNLGPEPAIAEVPEEAAVAAKAESDPPEVLARHVCEPRNGCKLAEEFGIGRIDDQYVPMFRVVQPGYISPWDEVPGNRGGFTKDMKTKALPSPHFLIYDVARAWFTKALEEGLRNSGKNWVLRWGPVLPEEIGDRPGSPPDLVGAILRHNSAHAHPCVGCGNTVECPSYTRVGSEAYRRDHKHTRTICERCSGTDSVAKGRAARKEQRRAAVAPRLKKPKETNTELDIDCPTCSHYHAGGTAGRKCTRPSGHAVFGGVSHDSRIKAWKAIQDEKAQQAEVERWHARYAHLDEMNLANATDAEMIAYLIEDGVYGELAATTISVYICAEGETSDEHKEDVEQSSQAHNTTNSTSDAVVIVPRETSPANASNDVWGPVEITSEEAAFWGLDLGDEIEFTTLGERPSIGRVHKLTSEVGPGYVQILTGPSTKTDLVHVHNTRIRKPGAEASRKEESEPSETTTATEPSSPPPTSAGVVTTTNGGRGNVVSGNDIIGHDDKGRPWTVWSNPDTGKFGLSYMHVDETWHVEQFGRSYPTREAAIEQFNTRWDATFGAPAPEEPTDEERIHQVSSGELPGSFASAQELGNVSADEDEKVEVEAAGFTF